MDTALHPHIATGLLAVRRSDSTRALGMALQTSVAVLIGAVMISVLLVASLFLVGPATLSSPRPIPEAAPQPSAAAGLDL